MNKNIAVISLGCDKNRIDTEKMLYYLSGGKYTITSNYDDADVIIINTCAFIESARVEAIDTIFEMTEYKKGRCSKLIVTGCLVEKYRKELESDLPEVDAFLGISEYEKIISIIDGTNIILDSSDKRILTTPAHYAYLRIADGCDNHCTFCNIPSIRGRYRSKTIDSLLSETDYLIDSGIKELILIAQDVTSYGKDLGEYQLITLLEGLLKKDINWIRLMYCYPELVGDDLISLLATSPKLCKYIDIPMQHADDSVLKLMNRRGRNSDLKELLTKINLANPQITVRTTFMVGFPGETDAAFQNLYDFAKEFKLTHAGIFCYSKEEDTPSAKLKGQIPQKIKEERLNILGELISDNYKKRNKSLIGKELNVLYEDIDFNKNMFVGRAEFDAPEIDGNIYFSGDFADVGEFYKVKITDYDGYDLIGEIKK